MATVLGVTKNFPPAPADHHSLAPGLLGLSYQATASICSFEATQREGVGRKGRGREEDTDLAGPRAPGRRAQDPRLCVWVSKAQGSISAHCLQKHTFLGAWVPLCAPLCSLSVGALGTVLNTYLSVGFLCWPQPGGWPLPLPRGPAPFRLNPGAHHANLLLPARSPRRPGMQSGVIWCLLLWAGLRPWH